MQTHMRTYIMKNTILVNWKEIKHKNMLYLYLQKNHKVECISQLKEKDCI